MRSLTKNLKVAGPGVIMLPFRFRYESTGPVVEDIISPAGTQSVASVSVSSGTFTVTLGSGFRPRQLISGVAVVEGGAAADLAWVDADSFSASAGTFDIITALDTDPGTAANPTDECIVNCVVFFQELESQVDS